MRESELRRLFRHIVVAAIPVPVAIAASACGGTVDAAKASPEGASTGGAQSLMGTGGFVCAGFCFMQDASVGSGGGGLGTGTGGVSGAGGAAAIGAGGSRVGPLDAGVFLGTRVLLESSTATLATCPGLPAVDAGHLRCLPAYCVAAVSPNVAAGTAECRALCNSVGPPVLGCEVLTSGAATLLKCHPDCTGRRPAGLLEQPTLVPDHVAAYFTELAHLEAASVGAFRALGRELVRYGAPLSLRRAARRAARDEIRHARLAKSLACRFGGTYVPPRVSLKSASSLEMVARENATEGCVRETFGALMATWQARTAGDPVVRQAMRQIARDETRHAALAWRIARWAERKLDPRARDRVRASREAAVAKLVEELRYQPSPRLVAAAGVPSGRDAEQLAIELSAKLWS